MPNLATLDAIMTPVVIVNIRSQNTLIELIFDNLTISWFIFCNSSIVFGGSTVMSDLLSSAEIKLIKMLGLN
jgi:hypothetical protein